MASAESGLREWAYGGEGRKRGEKVGQWEKIRPARENHGPEARLAQIFFKFDFPNTFSNEF